jgi:hypothetical protein
MWKIEVSGSAGVSPPPPSLSQSVPSPSQKDVLMAGECFNTAIIEVVMS